MPAVCDFPTFKHNLLTVAYFVSADTGTFASSCPMLLYKLFYYWLAYWASIVLLAGVCRRLSSSSVMLPAGGQAIGRMGCQPPARRVGGRAADTARWVSTVTLH